MTIEIHTPELERLMNEEILRGSFLNVDDLLTQALKALREKAIGNRDLQRKSPMNRVTFGPIAGSEINAQTEEDAKTQNLDLPILHLGVMDALHRRDIYNDVL